MNEFEFKLTLDSGVVVQFWRIGQIVLEPGQPVKVQLNSYLDQASFEAGRAPVSSNVLQFGKLDNLDKLLENVYNLILNGIRTDPNLPFKKQQDG